MPVSRQLRRLILVVVLGASLLPLGVPAGATYPSEPVKALFARIRGSNELSDVWSVRFDDREYRNLTDGSPARAYPGKYSPGGGERIVYVAKRDGQFDVFIAKANGTRAKRITRTSTDEFWPSWGSGGGRVVFARVVAGGRTDLFSARDDGKRVERLSDTPHIDERYPVFNPNGGAIVFTLVDNTRHDVWLMAQGGGDRRPVTSTPAPEDSCDWAPDGGKLLLSKFTDGKGDLYTINPNGTDLKAVDRTGRSELCGYFAPGGHQIIYDAKDRSRIQVFTQTRAGKNKKQLTKTSWADNRLIQPVPPD